VGGAGRGSGGDAGNGLALTAAGQLALVGTFGGTTAQFGTFSLTNTAGATGVYNPASGFLATLSPAGTWLGAVATQGGETVSASALAVDRYGNVSMGGSFTGASATVAGVPLSGVAGRTTGFVTLVPMVPLVDNLAPSSGAPGQVVTVTGSGFVGVTDVLFNGKPAASFTVQSATQLVATVPVGVTAGPVSVRTGIGTSTSVGLFQPGPLATAVATAASPLAWPNPAGVAEPWHVQLPAAGPAPTRAEVRNLLGQLLFQTQFSGLAARLAVPGLAPGVYQLTLRPAGQPAWQQRIVVAN